MNNYYIVTTDADGLAVIYANNPEILVGNVGTQRWNNPNTKVIIKTCWNNTDQPVGVVDPSMSHEEIIVELRNAEWQATIE